MIKNWIRKLAGVDELEARHKREREEIDARFNEVETDYELELANARARIEELTRIPEEVEPRVEIVSSGIDADGMSRLQLEWNEEFIEHLRVHGYEGATDEEIVNQWLNALMSQYQRPHMTGNGIDNLDMERDSFDRPA